MDEGGSAERTRVFSLAPIEEIGMGFPLVGSDLTQGISAPQMLQKSGHRAANAGMIKAAPERPLSSVVTLTRPPK